MSTLIEEFKRKSTIQREGKDSLSFMYKEAVPEKISQAYGLCFQNGYYDIVSHRAVLGPIIIFLKRVVRKLIKIFMGWYVFPIYQKQTSYNYKLVEIVKAQADEIQQLKQANHELAEKVEYLIENRE